MRVALLLAAVTSWPAAPSLAQPGAVSPSTVAAALAASCSDAARRDVTAGVTALLTLEAEDARASFGRAWRDDPSCAVAGLGLALAELRLPDLGATPGEWARAEEALSTALASKGVPASAEGYLGAARSLIEPPTSTRPARLRAFAGAAAALAAQRREDPLAAAVAALAALANSSLPGDEWSARAAALIAPHAGTGTTPIETATPHALACAMGARDRGGEQASREDLDCLASAQAIVAAELGALRAPRAPRALRAAARVFLRQGRWDEAEAADVQALAAAGGLESPVWLEAGRWDDHPLPWLVQADVERGRLRAAHARLGEARERYAQVSGSLSALSAWRLRSVIDLAWLRAHWGGVDWQGQRRWPDPAAGALLEIPAPPPAGERLAVGDDDLARETRAVRALVQGLLAARAAWPRGEPERLAEAREAATALAALGAERPAPPRFEWMRTAVLASIAAALEARDELALLLVQLDALHRELVATGTAAAELVPSEALAGELHLQLRDAAQAAQRFGLAVHGAGEARAWLGRARAEREGGRDAAARAAYERFLAIWHGADADRPERVGGFP